MRLPSRSVSRRPLPQIAPALVLLVGLLGCGGSAARTGSIPPLSPPGTGLTPTPTSSPTQPTTGSTSPPGSPPATGSPTGTTASTDAARTTTAPPSQSATFTDADAIRAVQAYADGLSRSFQTGDPKYLAAVTDDLCPCRYAPQAALKALRDGHEHTDANATVSGASIRARASNAATVHATLSQSAYDTRDSRGHVVRHVPARSVEYNVTVQVKNGALIVTRLDEPAP